MFVTKQHINPEILCNVLAPIFISGFFGNIICIVVFLRRRFRTRSISVYFIALFFNDCVLLFISHVAKMLIFDASASCGFNIYLSKFIDMIRYREMIYRHGFAVLTYNTTYTQISMLIFMFMSIQRVRTFSSISYRESRMCALMLTLIAVLYGILVSYIQLYDAFCIEPLKLTSKQNIEIDSLLNETISMNKHECSMNFKQNHSNRDLRRIRHRTIAYVYLQSYMSIDWPDEHVQRSKCHLESILPSHLLGTIQNLTWPQLQSRPGLDYFHEHQFCTQTYHFIGSYANCSIQLRAENFQRWYKFLYDRRLSLTNRYTIGFIIGTFIPSCICVVSSFICLYYIASRPSIRKHSHSRAELRSLSLILVEILLSLMSALQSYVINFFTCHRLLFRMESDNCYGQSSGNILPNFLGSIVELFTSTSNILILMICGAQFRHELIEILHLHRLFRIKDRVRRRTNQQSFRLDPKGDRPMMNTRVNQTKSLITRSSNTNPQTTERIPGDISIDSLVVSSHNREDPSSSDVEHTSDVTNQLVIKSIVSIGLERYKKNLGE